MAKTSSKQSSSRGFFGLLSVARGSSSVTTPVDQNKNKKKAPIRADMGQPNKFYYDEKRKRWVEEGNEGGDDDTLNPPPPPSSRVMSPSSDQETEYRRKTDVSERYPKSTFGDKGRTASNSSLNLRPKSRPLSPSNTFVPDVTPSTGDDGSIYGNDNINNNYTANVYASHSAKDSSDLDLNNGENGNLYATNVYASHGAKESSDLDHNNRDNGNLYKQNNYYQNAYNTNGNKQLHKEQPSQDQVTTNLYGNSLSQLYGQTNIEQQLDQDFNTQEQQLQDDLDPDVTRQEFHKTQESQPYMSASIEDKSTSVEHENGYENDVVAGDTTYGSQQEVSGESYNEAYAHYSDWINQKWGEYVMQLSEWEQQQLSVDASYYESRFSEWGQSAYMEYYQLFPEQSHILFAGQLQDAQYDNGHYDSEKVEGQDMQQQEQESLYDREKNNYVAPDQGENICIPPLDNVPDAYPHQEASYAQESVEDTLVSKTVTVESVVRDNSNSQHVADEKVKQQEPTQDMSFQIEHKDISQETITQIQPYPSLESWVDVPIKKLGKLGKLGGPTPWEQDLLTETEDEEESLEEEQEPLSNNAARDQFSQPLYLQSRDVSPISCTTPRFDLVPHPQQSDNNVEDFVLKKSNVSEDEIHEEQQRALRSTLQIFLPQPSSEEPEQPITPIGQAGEQIVSGYSSVTTPESIHLQSTTLIAKNEEISSLQKRIVELEQLLSSKQKEIDVIQRSQNDLLIALGQENGKVEKLREMLVDYGASEEVIDEVIDEVEDEFGWGDEDEEEEEGEEEGEGERIIGELEVSQEAPQVDIC